MTEQHDASAGESGDAYCQRAAPPGAIGRAVRPGLPSRAGPGDVVPLMPAGSPPAPLRLLRADRTFPDGSAELVNAVGTAT